MTLVVADLLAPKGDVEASFFPDEDSTLLSARVQGYLDDAEERTADITPASLNDEAVRAWVMHRVYRAVYARLSSAPSSVSLADQGSSAYSATQINAFRDLADAALARYKGLMPVAAPVSTSTAIPASGAVPNVYSW